MAIERKIRPLRRAVIKEEYVAITGDMMEAVILSQMIYWSERVNDFDKFIGEERNRQQLCGEKIDDFPLLCGWIHKSAGELKEEIMSDDSPKTILRKLDSLVTKGFISRRRNPDHPYDRIYQYRVNFMVLLDSLAQEGYTLEGYRVEFDYTVEKDNTAAPNEQSENQQEEKTKDAQNSPDHSKGQIDHSISQGVSSERHGVLTIPETTTEITSEITSSSSHTPTIKKQNAKMEDRTGEVSDIIDAMGIGKLRHKEMVEPIRAILLDLLLTGKVGRNQFQCQDIENTLRQLNTADIDGVIDRFATQAKKRSIPCPDDYLKTSLLKAGRTS